MEPFLPDDVFLKLLPYQIQPTIELGYCLDNNDCIINGSGTGVGKTYSTCALAKWKRRRIFIICPKEVIEIWFKVCGEFGVDILGVANYECAKNGKYYESLDMYMKCNRVECPFIIIDKNDKLEFKWDVPDDILIVYDEAHKGKNHFTINSHLLASTKTAFRDNGPKVILLSATLTDTVECFQTPAYLLGLVQPGKHYFRAWLRNLARLYPGKTTAESIHNVLYPKYGSCIRISELKKSENDYVRELFKHNDVCAQTYPMSPDAELEITNAYHEIEDAVNNLKIKQRDETCILTVILRARQRIEMLKIPTIAMLAMEYLLNEGHVVIFVNFNETLDQLFTILDDFAQTEFKSFITIIRCGQSPTERAYNLRMFQEDKSLVMICNVMSGGVGISLHGVNRVSLISPPWSSIVLKQALGRVYRAGGGDVTQRIIYCQGGVSAAGEGKHQNDTTFNGERGVKIGVEELIAEKVNKKLKTIDMINNGNEDDVDLI